MGGPDKGSVKGTALKGGVDHGMQPKCCNLSNYSWEENLDLGAGSSVDGHAVTPKCVTPACFSDYNKWDTCSWWGCG